MKSNRPKSGSRSKVRQFGRTETVLTVDSQTGFLQMFLALEKRLQVVEKAIKSLQRDLERQIKDPAFSVSPCKTYAFVKVQGTSDSPRKKPKSEAKTLKASRKPSAK